MFSLAGDGQLPAPLARIHARFRTPATAVVVHTLIAWGLAVASSFLGALTASTLTRLMLYGLTAAAAFVLRRRGLTEKPDPLLLPGGSGIAVAALLLCLWLMLQSDGSAWMATSVCLLLGAGAWAGFARRGPAAEAAE
jgi:amino acid transporter